MDLLEYQGKELFKRHSIPVPASVVFRGKSADLPGTDRLVAKAQIPAGKREEHGGIKAGDRFHVLNKATELLNSEIEGEKVRSVLIEEQIDIEHEYYLSLSINRAGKDYNLVFSEQGGSGIEQVSQENPGAIHRLEFYEFDEDKIKDALGDIDNRDAITGVVRKMHSLMREEDALLVEINPLALTADGEMVALDSKVRLDDNATYRHERDFLEEPEEHDIEFVDLDGNIGVIGNGAGLVMATIDAITHFGGRPSDFLDIGGGADFETMENSMETLIDRTHVDGMFINIFGGITKCDEVAKGIIDFVDENDVTMPLVVRMVGTNQQEGRQILEDNGIHALDSMDDCAEKIVDLVGGT